MPVNNGGKQQMLNGFKNAAVRMRLLDVDDNRLGSLEEVSWGTPTADGSNPGTYFLDISSNVQFSLSNGDIIHKIQVVNSAESVTFATYEFLNGSEPTFAADGTYTVTEFKIEVS